MTTGTTVSECARVLKRAGADKVFAATVARTLKAPVTPEFQQTNRGGGSRGSAIRLGRNSYVYGPELSFAIR